MPCARFGGWGLRMVDRPPVRVQRVRDPSGPMLLCRFGVKQRVRRGLVAPRKYLLGTLRPYWHLVLGGTEST